MIFRKALVIAMVMVMSMSIGAFAAYQGDTQSDDTFNNGTADGTISVSGLSAGDVVKFYKILAYDDVRGSGTPFICLDDQNLRGGYL